MSETFDSFEIREKRERSLAGIHPRNYPGAVLQEIAVSGIAAVHNAFCSGIG